MSSLLLLFNTGVGSVYVGGGGKRGVWKGRETGENGEKLYINHQDY